MDDIGKFDKIFTSGDGQGVTFIWMKDISHFPSHIASFSRSCGEWLTSIVDFKVV
jgi:hypothetical protein